MKGYFTMPYAYVADRNLPDNFWTMLRGEKMQKQFSAWMVTTVSRESPERYQ
jgi:hypothetical protein